MMSLPRLNQALARRPHLPSLSCSSWTLSRRRLRLWCWLPPESWLSRYCSWGHDNLNSVSDLDSILRTLIQVRRYHFFSNLSKFWKCEKVSSYGWCSLCPWLHWSKRWSGLPAFICALNIHITGWHDGIPSFGTDSWNGDFLFISLITLNSYSTLVLKCHAICSTLSWTRVLCFSLLLSSLIRSRRSSSLWVTTWGQPAMPASAGPISVVKYRSSRPRPRT